MRVNEWLVVCGSLYLNEHIGSNEGMKLSESMEQSENTNYND